ncbi:hypothetical protein MKX01_035401, partial [Papaver californicum]
MSWCGGCKMYTDFDECSNTQIFILGVSRRTSCQRGVYIQTPTDSGNGKELQT